ncbi:MAG: hypothetical protein M1834_004330 [Cirrosporium novae-zelandiae]|nr:MAG: hypothetical protein M1834_004330 [Cirrosporium novae-zelandiae]
MASTEIEDDYYAILEVSNTAGLEIIQKSYRQLAKSMHPDKNPNNPGATASFQRLAIAYDTIRDPEKQRAYDLKWTVINNNRRTQQEPEECRAEASKAKRKTEAEEEMNKRQERLRCLSQFKSICDNEAFEVRRTVDKPTAELKRLQDQDDEELKMENSWRTYFASLLGEVKETKEQKQRRQTARLERRAIRSIKETQLAHEKTDLQRFEDLSLETK